MRPGGLANVKLRQILLLIAAISLATSTTAAAATLGGTTTANLGAGSDQVPRCDTAVTIEYDVDQRFAEDNTTVISEATGVIISGINVSSGGCSGGLLRVVVFDEDDDPVFSDSRTIDSATEEFDFSAVDVGEVAGTLMVIEGGN